MATRDHVFGGSAEREEHAVQVHIQHPAPFFSGHASEAIFGGAAVGGDTGIGEAGVDMAKEVHCLSEFLCRLGLISDIAEDSFGWSALGQQDFFSSGVLVRVRTPDDNAGTGFCAGFRHAKADTAIAAGDQDGFFR